MQINGPNRAETVICICGFFLFFFSPKTPSQIQADIDACEGGQCRLGKNLSERKASLEFAAYAYKINSIFQQSGGEKEKKKPSSKLWWRSMVTIKMRQTNKFCGK